MNGKREKRRGSGEGSIYQRTNGQWCATYNAMRAEGLADVRWVFCTPLGNPMRRSHFHAYAFQPLLKRAKLPKIRFHDLRHTSATLLLSAGVHPKVVRERLGHSQISVTMDTYSHVLPGMQREAAAKMDEMLGGK